MGKRKPEFKIYSYGEYSQWDRTSKKLPRILNITETINAEIGTEFGYILKIKGGKGKQIDFRIEHPPFKNEKGMISPPFEGKHFISSNDYEFFLGDCIWEPLNDKLGYWRLISYFEGNVIADKAFLLTNKKPK